MPRGAKIDNTTQNQNNTNKNGQPGAQRNGIRFDFDIANLVKIL
jgi:hypothetical protein